MKHLFCGLMALGLLVGLAGDAKAQQTYSFSTLDVPGSVHTEALGIDDLGQIVGGFVDNTGGHGFLLDNGTYTTLDVWATGINDSGQILGLGGLLDNGNYTPLNVPAYTSTWA